MEIDPCSLPVSGGYDIRVGSFGMSNNGPSIVLVSRDFAVPSSSIKVVTTVVSRKIISFKNTFSAPII